LLGFEESMHSSRGTGLDRVDPPVCPGDRHEPRAAQQAKARGRCAA
jgi:hypothetical protein